MADAPRAAGRERGRWIGRSPTIREHDALVRGAACFAADVAPANALDLAFARSPVAHGTLAPPTLDAVRAMPGVVAAFTGKDVAACGALRVNPVLSVNELPPFELLARERVRHDGQPVVAVLADGAARARDAADAVVLDIRADDAAEPATVMADGWTRGDAERARAAAHTVVEASIGHPRLAPSPMEPRAITVEWRDGALDIHLATQTPHRARDQLARIAGLDPERLRVRAVRVGGAFGMKASVTPEEAMAVWVAARLRRSVRWSADRGEDLAAAPHGRATRTRGWLALDGDGRFVALGARVEAEIGAWATTSAGVPAWNAARIPPGPYAVAHVDARTEARASATAPIGIYRGAGRPEAAMLVETLIDAAAAETGIDPLEMRRRNLVPEGAHPHALPSGHALDSGAYVRALDRLRAVSGYEDLRAVLPRRRADGDVVGLGLACYVEPSGAGWESARVRLMPDGTVEASVGATSQGHGRETAFAQIVADALGTHPDLVRIVHGDTGLTPEGVGALASRSTAIGGGALHEAARRVAARSVGDVPAEGIEETVRFEAPGEAWGFGAHAALVAIDRETGVLTVEGYWMVDDAGVLVNPRAAREQIRGGLAQGYGEAAMERVVYDDDGTLLTGSLLDYAVPRAADVAFVGAASLDHVETPSPMNPLGAKGCGEAGTIGGPAAIRSAVADALRPLGVEPPPMPMTPCRLWHAVRGLPE